MSNSQFEKKEAEEARIISINTDNHEVDFENVSEVVYKPTTMNNDGKWNQNIQSFKPEKQDIPKDSVFLYRTAFIGNLLAFAAGIGFSWGSPVLPKLQGSESPLTAPIDASQESIIAAIICVGAAVGPFLFGYLSDKIGRKLTLITIAIPMVVGMSILAFTGEVKMYYLGRLLYGIGIGGVFTVLTMYIGEITADHNRGKFSCILGIFVALGVLFPLSVGSLLSVKIFCLMSLVPLLLFFFLFLTFAPDSPTYLVRKGKLQEAKQALINLHSFSNDRAEIKLNELQLVEKRQSKAKGGIIVLFKARGTRRAFMVSSGLLILQQVSGINAVIGFMENIFKATGSTIPANISTTLVGSIQVVTVLITSTIIEKLGRKLLLLGSALGSAVSIILLGLYFFLHQQKSDLLVYLWWLPISCLLLYIVCFNLGLGPLPWTVLSEVFPDNVKASASALASATCFGVSFVVTMAFPIISSMLGMAQSFWLFGGCCIIGAIFIKCVVPETKGRSVDEIQEILEK